MRTLKLVTLMAGAMMLALVAVRATLAAIGVWVPNGYEASGLFFCGIMGAFFVLAGTVGKDL